MNPWRFGRVWRPAPLTATVLVRSLARMVRSIAIARVLGPTGRGAIAAMTVATDISGRSSTLGLGAAASRESALSPDAGRRAVATSVLWLAMCLPLLGGAAIAIAVWTFDGWGYSVVVVAGFCIFVWLAAMAGGLAGEVYWLAVRPQVVAVGQLLAASMAFVVLLLWVFGQLSLSAAIICSTAAIISPWLLYLGLLLPIDLRTRLPLRAQLGFGIRALPGLLANSVNQRVDMVLVAGLVGLSAAGHYAVAVGATQMSTSFGVAWAKRAQVRLSEAHDQPAVALEEINRSAWGAIYLGLVSALVVPGLILFAYGQEFTSSIVPALLLLPGACAQVVTTVGTRVLTVVGLPGVASRAELLGVAVTAIGVVPAVSVLGIAGAALLSSIAYLVRVAYIHARLERLQ